MSDLIDRNYLFDLLKEEDRCGYLDAEDIKNAPSAEPKKGKWVFKRLYHEADECICSECGQLMTTAHGKRMRFCPNCGAKMEVDE